MYFRLLHVFPCLGGFPTGWWVSPTNIKNMGTTWWQQVTVNTTEELPHRDNKKYIYIKKGVFMTTQTLKCVIKV